MLLTMRSFTAVILLSAFVFANGYSISAAPDIKDALAFIKCTQTAIITGIPEAGIPSHDPLKFAENVSLTLPLDLISLTVNLNNLVLDGTPWWNVTEASQSVSDDPNVDIFKFTIYWPNISFSLDWDYDLKLPLEENKSSGTFYLELDHVNFHIEWQSTQAHDGENGTLDEFSLAVDTKDAKVNLTNFGELGDIINAVGGPVVAFFVNNNPVAGEFSEQLKQRFIKEWIEKPERIDAINANCNK